MCRWDPEDYSKHSREQEKWALELIPKLDLKGGERVLDIGCGDGKITAAIADALGSDSSPASGFVLGIDSSPEMVAHAQKSFTDDRRSLAFLCLDARDIDFSREFDVVFSNAALHWVPDHLPLLVRIRHALRPSGRVLLQMGGKGNAAGMVDVVSRVIGEDPWRPFFEGFSFPWAFYGPEEYRGLMEAAGLAPRRVEIVPKTMLHKGRDGLAGWVRTTWMPYSRMVPDAMRERFVEEIVSAYEAEHGPDAEGFFAVSMARLEAEGVNT
jgi:trans-aconitate methyltransferase